MTGIGTNADPDHDPAALTVDLVCRIEQHLSRDEIHRIVTGLTRDRAKQRRLARALAADPGLLTTGRPPAPRAVAELLVALRAAGAQAIAAPRCDRCDRPQNGLRRWASSSFRCTTCTARHGTCAGCGRHRRLPYRDGQSQPHCKGCRLPDTHSVEELILLLTALDPALTRTSALKALTRAAALPRTRQRLARQILDQPDLLTKNAHQAPSPAVLRLIDELTSVGASQVAKPLCPRCNRLLPLTAVHQGVRICRTCYGRARATACARCGALRDPATRDSDGAPICSPCLQRDPINHEQCCGCGRRRQVAARRSDGPYCSNCRPRQHITCSICERTRPGWISPTTGKPWCDACEKRWAVCTRCSTVAPVRGGSTTTPLCAQCVNPDPQFWKRCTTCKAPWQLTARPCTYCLLDQRLRAHLTAPNGQLSDYVTPLHTALTGHGRPDTTLAWLARPPAGTILQSIATAGRPLTHGLLDTLPHGKAVDHLRAVLVAARALPARDEYLVRLEQWIHQTLQDRTDPEHRRILHSYAIWHHLRRLRSRLLGTPATRLQAVNVHSHITAAMNFLDWLHEHDLTLAICTQADLEAQITDPHSTYPRETSHFIRWAVTHRHAQNLTYHAVAWPGPTTALDTERRWAQARRLLHDGTIPTADRVAGLLVLLYAQRPAAICRLTTAHVLSTDRSTQIRCGRKPITLPEPIAGLVRELTATRHRGRNKDSSTAADTPWLFPGIRPGTPLDFAGLDERLKKIGLRPRADRSTALFALAGELPAALLATLLGVTTDTAVTWQQIAAGDWTAYAADAARRRRTPSQPS
ncbi:site-specific integrase [Streptomyces sp. NPDC048424]|uniref:site-specific integrase n=1 Tax=Streptomyces sp. NPDC048424 TaxID=3155265 RepID=UPI003428FB75